MYYKRKLSKVGIRNMKPRIFVSSTFYDLKAVREDLYHFIRQYNYEPIESERGDIGYVPGQDLDKSCYSAMKDCDMAILIIGGRYGSPATDEGSESEDYISVTHKEFRTAIKNGIPVYAFIEQAVSTEYDLYRLNKERFRDPKFQFEFGAVDNICIFKFIAELKNISGIPIVSFSKMQDIKEYLSIQWADMFKKYLELLRKKSTDKKMTDSVEQMRILMDKMNVMLDTVGKKILTDEDSNEYESVVEKQTILSVAANLVDSLELSEGSFIEDIEERKLYIYKLVNALRDSIKTDVWEKYQNEDDDIYMEFFEYFDEKGIDIYCSEERLCDEIKRNIDIFETDHLKQILVDEISKDENYRILFETIHT